MLVSNEAIANATRRRGMQNMLQKIRDIQHIDHKTTEGFAAPDRLDAHRFEHGILGGFFRAAI